MIRLMVYGFLVLGLSNLYLLGQVVSTKIYDQIRRDNINYYSGISDMKIAPIDLEIKKIDRQLAELRSKR